MKYSFTSFGLISALLLASFGPLGGCYDPPKVQTGGGAGGMGGMVDPSATASSSSGQGGGACTPNSVMECSPYSGPPKTDNIGACKPSISTCLPEGSWSTCLAEVIPTIETCQSNADLNCDSLVPCSGTPIRIADASGTVQSPKDESIYALAIGPSNKGADGNVYAVGARNAILSGVPNEQRVLLWNQKPDGTIQDWSNLFALSPNMPTNNAYATTVGVVPTSGDIVIGGSYIGGALAIGAGGFQPSTSISSFLTRISPTGMVNMVQLLNVGGSLEVLDLAIDKLGNIYLGGTYTGSPTVQGSPLPAASGDDGFLVRMNSDGEVAWFQTFTGIGLQSVTSIVVMNPDDLIISITFTESMMISTPQGSQVYDAGPTVDGLVLRMDGFGGVASWVTQLPSSATLSKITVRDIAVQNNMIAVGGKFRGTAMFGSLDYTTVNNDIADAFVATLDINSGGFLSHFTSQGMGEQQVNAVAFDSVGDLLIAGTFSNTMPLPQIPPMTSAANSAFVAKLKSSLTGVWGYHFGDSANQGSQLGESVIVGNGTGHIYMGGAFQGSLPQGNGSVSSVGGLDAFVLQLGD